MSNIPTPQTHPLTPQQVTGILNSVLEASHGLITSDAHHAAELRTTFIQFYSHPIFQLLLGVPSQTMPTPPHTDHQLKAELSELRSTITALSKTVSGLQTKLHPALPPPPK